MKRLLVFVLLAGFTCRVTAQKQVRKTLLNDRTESILVATENCFEVSLETVKGNELRVEAEIEGEYAKNLIVNLEEEGTSVLVSAGFQPGFSFPNDKLSAHKVISITMKIVVPEYKRVKVYGTNTHVSAKGNYDSLNVLLDDGECHIIDVGENVDVATQKGNIWLSATSGVITAESSYGEVFTKVIPKGDNHYVLSTKEGNIYLNKTK